jgi:hypothetical protein
MKKNAIPLMERCYNEVRQVRGELVIGKEVHEEVSSKVGSGRVASGNCIHVTSHESCSLPVKSYPVGACGVGGSKVKALLTYRRGSRKSQRYTRPNLRDINPVPFHTRS